MSKTNNYQVIEDNAGGMYLFFFGPDDQVILGVENIEYAQPGDLDQITLDEARTWDSQLTDPQAHYDELTSFDLGWSIVADQNGVYSTYMGRAARIVFGVEDN